MANPNPSPENRFKPGWKGGPGAPKGPRFTTRIMQLIEQGKLEDHVATAWLGMLLGDERFLKGRKPNYQFFKEFLDRVDGPIAQVTRQETDDDAPKRINLPRRNGTHNPKTNGSDRE